MHPTHHHHHHHTDQERPALPRRAPLAAALLAPLALSLASCAPFFDEPPAYPGEAPAADGEPCGPCGVGVALSGACDVGDLAPVVSPGDACSSLVFVDASAPEGDGAEEGTPDRPVATLARARELALERGAKAIVVRGDVAGPLVVAGSVSVLGGSQASWRERTAPPRRAVAR